MPSKQNLAVAAAAVGGLLAVGGATYAFADPSTPAPSPSASSSSSTGTEQGAPQSQDKAVTGTVADAVKAAVKAKDASVTIDTVRQDPDGSYDALGSKSDGTKVFYDVSKDYKTVTLNVGGPGGRGGGHGGASDTVVTGTVATSVKAAVTAKYSGVTISEVRQDADGSYDAVGTKADGSKVFYEVSKALTTITERTGPSAGKGAPQGSAPSGAAPSGAAPSGSATPGS